MRLLANMRRNTNSHCSVSQSEPAARPVRQWLDISGSCDFGFWHEADMPGRSDDVR
jgi:hypothetical protein